MTTLRLNALAPAWGSKKQAKRVGRGAGSGLGKTSGKGHKGQNARSGGGVRAGFEGGQMPLQKRLPKFGFYSRLNAVTQQIRLSELAQVEGDEITIDALRKAGLLRHNQLRARIMLKGDVSKAYRIAKEIKVTKGARLAIERAGGSIAE